MNTMNKENQILQRDQIKRPIFHKLVNSNSNSLSSPFPFMEFGLSSQSSLSNVLNCYSREIGNFNKTSLSKHENQDSTNTDPYLKPFSVDRFKSANIVNRETSDTCQINHNFIKFSSNHLQNNTFSANFFLRLQSTRKDSVENLQKTNDNLNNSSKNNDIHKIKREKLNGNSMLMQKDNPILNGNNKEVPMISNLQNLSNGNFENFNNGNNYYNRPITANSLIKQSVNSSNQVPFTGRQQSAKFYVKSFKTDALIYNPNNKGSTSNQNDVKTVDSNHNSSFKISNGQPLYLQVKQEVEEYRKQRQTEVMLDVDTYPGIKSISEEFYTTKMDIQQKSPLSQDPPVKVPESKSRIVYSNLKTSEELTSEEKVSITNKNKTKEICIVKSIARPKSVTFNDKVETKDFYDSSSSESADEDSSDETSTNDEANASIVSNESESEDNTQMKQRNERNMTSSKSEILLTNENKSQPVSKKTVKDINDEDVDSGNEFDDAGASADDHNRKANNKICDDSDKENQINDIESESDSNSDDSSIITTNSLKPDSLYDTDKTNENSTLSTTITTISRPGSAISVQRPTSNFQKTSESKIQSSSEKLQKKSTSESRLKPPNILTKQGLLEMTLFKETKNHLPLIFSKFPNVPPVINFVSDGEKIEQLPWQLRKLLKWRPSLLTPLIVKQTITRSGFRPSRYTSSGDDLDTAESNDWILYFGKHMKGPTFKSIKEYQKVNHFPGSFQLGRKDRLWKNILRMQQESGNHEFDFIPQTFCLPADLESFKQYWESGGDKYKWIIKPPASARGIGVKVVYKWNQIPKRRPVIVQRYVCNPYLINDSKFDLRLYVFITGINPLRIYLYEDGLVRFASTKYSKSVKTLHNRFVHLTNYSINKQNLEYIDNNDNEACKGHKWSLKSLWSYLKKRGVNTDNVWQKIKDLVVKTVISAEDSIGAAVNLYCKSSYSVQELFGFDVILDENLKPWILEVNVSPSLHSDSPLDIVIKGNMIKDMFNLSGILLPEPADVENPTNVKDKPPSTPTCVPPADVYIDRRFWLYEPSDDEIEKMKHFVFMATSGTDLKFDPSNNFPFQILDCLTPRDVRYLLICTDENDRRGKFERIYPISSANMSKKYLSFFEKVHYSNILIASFLIKYGRNNQGTRLLENLCQKKLHLYSVQNGKKIDPKHVWKISSYLVEK